MPTGLSAQGQETCQETCHVKGEAAPHTKLYTAQPGAGRTMTSGAGPCPACMTMLDRRRRQRGSHSCSGINPRDRPATCLSRWLGRTMQACGHHRSKSRRDFRASKTGRIPPVRQKMPSYSTSGDSTAASLSVTPEACPISSAVMPRRRSRASMSWRSRLPTRPLPRAWMPLSTQRS